MSNFFYVLLNKINFEKLKILKSEINTIWIDLNEELYKFILGKIKDEQTSKDIHQEVFLKIQTKIHQLKHTSKLTSCSNKYFIFST